MSASTPFVYQRFVPAPDNQRDLGVGIQLQITRLVGTYMVWAGVCENGGGVNAGPTEEDTDMPLGINGNLALDWACAMPSGSATPLFRSQTVESTAFSTAQRLAKRFKKQFFVSVDSIPPTLAFEAEKAIVIAIKELEGL
ncbi:hypothetical protein FISHEDRAFT_78629 [Fistulina hepatica ATCC 64428]|uniref:Uncharacterized protein n=1 Tax=Fistulina hepatica ATCC 64428 TaxID=1128425 RepID=A0A0D7A1J4_9AGAR|nr:hypothetical protein FISHEDRAFT_78629 [Fistulina hepatica ATCC 64428]